MKIVVDENIIYAREFFSKTASETNELVLKAGRDITQSDLIDADALLVRSVTQVNAQLLDGTQVKFVGTATIGTDHIDQHYLQDNGITFADAAGCSADTVAQYVITAIHALRPQHLLEKITLGIVGYGNIGKALARISGQLGWNTLVYDPFVTVDEACKTASFDDVLAGSDVISLHVPLTYPENSDYPTHHLINAAALEKIPAETLLVNSARGKVVCEADLLTNIAQTRRDVVLDVFEHEPRVSNALLDALAIATPHIAGYSLEGKARGTQFIYHAFCQWQGVSTSQDFQALLPAQESRSLLSNQGLHAWLAQHLLDIYNINKDHEQLRHSVLSSQNAQQQMALFDQLRKQYALRREWQAYGLSLPL